MGGELRLWMTTETRPVALSGGKPSSVTMTPKWLVVPPLPLGVVQLSWPAAGSTVTPGGAPARSVKVKVCGGRSGSLTAGASWKASPSLRTTRLVGGGITGGVLVISATVRASGVAGGAWTLPALSVATL